jgi:predicted nucleic acid-binding protein
MVLVDTPIWSSALRRFRGPMAKEAAELTDLIQRGQAEIIGPVRQELLSGVKTVPQFESLRDHLRAFPDMDLAIDDVELAADFFNRCRAKGIQGSNTDFLICAVASLRRHFIFTVDADFVNFARVLPIRLHHIKSRT